MKQISIVTVNYNNKAGLERTILSVINQTAREFEFIVIDGGSTDGSKDVLKRYQTNFNHWISEPDSGIYNAMNKGIKLATGNYICFLNSGDVLSKDTILEEVEQQIDPTAGIIYGDAAYLEPNGKVIRNYPDELSFRFFLEQNLSHQASFIRRSLFSDLFYYNENYKIVSDWEFFAYAICKANIPYKHLNLVICDYDTTGISSIISNHKAMNEERSLTMDRYFSLFLKDYEKIFILNSKRGQQFFYIKEHRFAYKILKGLMSIIMLLLPRVK